MRREEAAAFTAEDAASSRSPDAGRTAIWRPRPSAGRQPADTVPTITIGSDFDGPNKDGTSYRKMFTGPYSHRVLDGIGHNVPQEAPQDFANAVIAVDGH
jgi:pimeloyl-ACP methyl ester carboxylesterase